MFLIRYAFFQFHDMMKSYFVLKFVAKGFWAGMSFFSIPLIEDNDDQLFTIITRQYSRLKASPIFFRECSLLKLLLHSVKDKTWFISSGVIEVSIRIQDRWSYCPDSNKVCRFYVVFSANDDSPVSRKFQLLYSGLI